MRSQPCSTSKWTLTHGVPEALGAVADSAGVNFAVFSANADAIAVCLFDDQDAEIARLRLPSRTGNVFHGHIAGLTGGTRYGLRAFGPWDPSEGHRFNPAKLLLDPYASTIDRPFRLDPDLFDIDRPNPNDTAPLMPKALVAAGFEAAPAPRRLDWQRQVIYELHVRGFTRLHPEIPEPQRGTFAGLGHPAAVEYLQRLGVTAVELMPSPAWVDDRHLPALGLANYWGYNPVAFLAPDPKLAPGGWPEVRAAVAALQSAGIAVLLDLVLNHTGEGDHLGPTLSLRGLDNATYYRINGERCVNHTGCGNTVALDRPPVLRLAMDAMRGWALRAGVDGFRLDLAATLGRREAGFDPDAPLLQAMQQDPVLAYRAVIAEPWDIGPGGYQLGAFPAGWGEWNDRARDNFRRFWRGDRATLGDLASSFAGSADVFATRHRPLSRSINFITAHDGFTLADLVSYETKHNAANREGNRDGAGENYSWNNGVEGPTDDVSILAARTRDVRALLATLLLARGTPMLSMGDEVGRSQHGNNNPYAQDNTTSWFDWSAMDTELLAFTARLVRLRLAAPVLCDERPLTGRAVDDSLIPDVVWRLPNGRDLTDEDWQSPENRTLVIAQYGHDQRLGIVLHPDSAATEVLLPEPRSGMRWRCLLDSADPSRSEPILDRCHVAPRSVLLLTEENADEPRQQGTLDSQRRQTGATSQQLDRLAGAVGIAPVWWDIDGGEHCVGDDTKRALLAAMRLPADSAADVTDSLARLAMREAAPLPPSLVVRETAAVPVPLGAAARGLWVTLRHENGSVQRLPVSRGTRHVALPALSAGRHTLLLEDAPDSACRLIVAPAHCYLPEDYAAGGRRFGIATHLYSLRRDDDHGIGDFTCLAHLARSGAEWGAAVIGLNPMHALFANDRSRASPYQPSDRRFLDPIYLDVSGMPGADALPEGDPSMVDYPAVWQAKRRVLQTAFASRAPDDAEFAAFLAAGGDALRQFAIFETIADDQGQNDWREWPAELRHPLGDAILAFADKHAGAILFACWLQYLGDRQLGAAASAGGSSLTLYRDLAVGAAPDGAEAWSRQDALLTGVSVGAPPDPFSQQGQVWGLPAPDPLAMAREGYTGFADLLGANMRHAGALRIDHVMGLQRLFLVPPGASAREGAYLGYPFRDLLGVLALESQRARCLVVGEALGTVPEGMPEALAAAAVLSYSVLWFERDPQHGLRRASAWRARAAACVSTHDLPTLAGWWSGTDIIERNTIALLESTADLDRRQGEKHELIALLKQEGLLDASVDLAPPISEAVVVAVHAFIASTPALLALVQADDLSGELAAVNLPGTDRERPNWRRRHRVTVDALCQTRLGRLVLQAMIAQGRDGGRSDL